MAKIAAIALMLALAGCAQTREAAEWLASDKARTAAVNLKAAAAALDCGLVVSGTRLSSQLAGPVPLEELRDATEPMASRKISQANPVVNEQGPR